MLKKNNLIPAPSHIAAESLLVSGDFIGRVQMAGAKQGSLQMTVTAREWTAGNYFVRIITSLMPGTFLYSQDQPENMRQLATRIEFHKNGGFTHKDKAIEIASHFIHTDGAYGLRPSHGNKVTFIQQIERRNDLCDISGRVYYQAFTENEVLEPRTEEFRIRLTN
jgi:hypothetical protein